MCPSLLHAKHRAPFGAWCEALSIFAGVTCWLAWCSPKFGRIYLLCCSQGALGLSGLTGDLPSFGACFGVGRCAGEPSGTKCCDSTLGAPFTSWQAEKKKKKSPSCALLPPRHRAWVTLQGVLGRDGPCSAICLPPSPAHTPSGIISLLGPPWGNICPFVAR